MLVCLCLQTDVQVLPQELRGVASERHAEVTGASREDAVPNRIHRAAV